MTAKSSTETTMSKQPSSPDALKLEHDERSAVLVQEQRRRNLQFAGRLHFVLVAFFLVAWIASPQMGHWITAATCLLVLVTSCVALALARHNIAIRRTWLALMIVDVVAVSLAVYPNLALSANLRGTAIVNEVFLLLFLTISLFSLERRVVFVVTGTIAIFQFVLFNKVGTPAASQLIHIGVICLFGFFGASLVKQALNLLAEVENLSNLKRFFSPAVAALILKGEVDPMKTHQTEITVVFVDLRGFTAFTESTAPDDVMAMLREYHGIMGKLIVKYDGTVEHFSGDGIMIFFNDPIPSPNPASQAVQMAVEMRSAFAQRMSHWASSEHTLGIGVGIAQGLATIGAIGFEGRMDYGAVGAVCNLSARLCAEARGGQILVEQRVSDQVESLVRREPVEQLRLKGISHPVIAFNILDS